MKTLVITLLMAFTSLMNAQSTYEKGMGKAFELWEAKNNQEAINLFERIAIAEKNNWIPYYYAAQIGILGTFEIEDAAVKKIQLEKAKQYLNESKSRTKDNVEVLVLEAIFYTAKLMTDPGTYGPTLSPKIEGMYQQAKAMAPNNPRVVVQHANWKMGSAKFFGKDPKVYCPELEKALALFDTEKESVPFYPSWGKERTQNQIEECKK